MQDLTQKIHYEFKQPALLTQALTHRSVVGQASNERLEFLGDAVLGLVMGKILYQLFPLANEGELSRFRAILVKEDTLFEIAKELDLSQHLQLGLGEIKTGGAYRKSILADAVEALLGAVYIDSGMKMCEKIIQQLFHTRLSALRQDSAVQVVKDAKTRLQEYLPTLKKDHLSLPVYTVIAVMGLSHTQCFHVRCQVSGIQHYTEGKGSSKKEAEQVAAGLFLDWLFTQ